MCSAGLWALHGVALPTPVIVRLEISVFSIPHSWPTLQSPHHFSSSPAHVLASQGTTHCALLNYTQIRCNALSLCIKVGRKISCLREKQNKTKTQNQTNTKITTNQPTNKTHQVPVHSMFCQGVSLACLI